MKTRTSDAMSKNVDMSTHVPGARRRPSEIIEQIQTQMRHCSSEANRYSQCAEETAEVPAENRQERGKREMQRWNENEVRSCREQNTSSSRGRPDSLQRRGSAE